MSDPGCFFHGEEPVPQEFFRMCLECGHVWPEHDDFQADVYRLFGEHRDDVSFCPLCTHDF